MVSDALSVEIAATNGEITALQAQTASAATDGELSSEVASIDLRVSNTEDDTTAVSDAVRAILAGSDVDLDQFAEVIAYVDSLDTLDGGALTTALGSIDTAISVGASVDAAVSGALVAEISATASDVLSIETVLGTMGTSETITNISNGLSSEIATTNTEVTAINNSIDALQAQTLSAATDAELGAVSDALSVEIAATNGEIAVLQAQNAYVHKLGAFRDATSFRLDAAMATGNDFLVFVNGHNIHPMVGEGEAASDGWSSTDGITIDMNSIGYILEADDHFYVTGNLA